MSRLILTNLLLATLGRPSPAAAPAPSTPRDGAAPAPAISIAISRCLIEYEHSSRVGSAQTGSLSAVLQDRFVQLGDRVKAGQLLGRLVDKENRAEMEMRRIEAESDLGIRVAEANYAYATAKLGAARPWSSGSF